MPVLSVIIPTFNESENIKPMIGKLEAVLDGIDWEAVFVDDDSADSTHGLVKELAQKNPRVRCLRRVGRKGLSSACIEGMMSSSAPFVAVMDADMQHDETRLPIMLDKFKADSELELVVGTRYADGGSTGGWSGLRLKISELSTKLSRMFIPNKSSDPMSGFFMMRRSFIDSEVASLSGIGFKLLLDILMSRKSIKMAEVPYTFKNREFGTSKLGIDTILDFILLVLDKTLGVLVPTQFILFGIVGGLGLTIQTFLLLLMHQQLGMDFLAAQGMAGLLVIAFNFKLDNSLTFKLNKLKGKQFYRGLLKFYLVCGIGLAGNVIVSSALYEHGMPWWGAGAIGAFYGAFMNFSVSKQFIWRGKNKDL